MSCPVCAATTRPGTIDGIHYAACCLVHGPLVWHSAAERERLVETPSVAKAGTGSHKQAEACTEAQTIILPYPPTTNHLYATVNGRRVKSKRAKEYNGDVLKLAMAARLRKIDGPVCLSFRVYRPRKRGDIDNVIKVVQDALSGIWYWDDEAVCELHVWRYEDRLSPRVEVTVGPAVTKEV